MSPSPSHLEAACERWLRDPRLQLATALPVGGLLAAGSATQLFVNWSLSGLETSFPALLSLKVVEFGLWAAAVPLVVRVDRRMDWAAGWARPLAVHLALAIGLFLVINAPVTALTKLGDATLPTLSYRERYLFRMTYRLPSSWITYAGILAVIKLMQAFVRERRLDRDLGRAQLQVLRDQIQPHFLFNTLHTAGALVRAGDRDGAVDALVALSDLLRRSLRHGRAATVPLHEEVDFLECYLGIHRRRFGEHLAVTIDIPHELAGLPVPPFLLQPLVENAILHGLDLDPGEGTVTVSARATPNRLRIEVTDSGGRIDEPAAEDDAPGIGLANLRGRLTTLYGGRATLEVAARNGVSVVTVALPIEGP